MLQMIHKTCTVILLVAAVLLASAGAMTGHPEEASQQSILSRIAYFTFLAVLLVLVSVCAKLFLYAHEKLRVDHPVVCRFYFVIHPISPLEYSLIRVIH